MLSRSAQTVQESSLFCRYFSSSIQREIDIRLLKQNDDLALYIVVYSNRNDKDRQVTVLAECGVRQHAFYAEINEGAVTVHGTFSSELKAKFQALCAVGINADA